MNRREAIKKTTLALGYAISAPALMGIMKGCKATPELSYTPQFFNNDQASLVSELAEIIIPKTTTPGAKDVGVPAFIDGMLNDFYTTEEKEKFLAGLNSFEEEAQQNYGNRFIKLDRDKQITLVKKHHDEALANQSDAGATGWWNAGSTTEKPFILKMKELTLLGFFTSEAGATQVLQHNPVPGPYRGCVPLTEVGKAWAI